MSDNLSEYAETISVSAGEETFALLERDARRYDKAFTEEAEAKHI